ncbi:UNVERIFIED_CONTAM: Protein DEK [Trichonephila clavipes]
MKCGLHVSFVKLKSSKNCSFGNELSTWLGGSIDIKNSVFTVLDLDLKFVPHSTETTEKYYWNILEVLSLLYQEWRVTVINDDEIKQLVKRILDSANLQEITMKKVIKQVAEAYPDCDLSHKKAFIKTTIKSVRNFVQYN